MTFAEQVKNELLELISDMADHVNMFVKNPKSDFTRVRKMDFKTLIHLIISMEAGSVKNELLKWFSFDADTITSSAFSQQRAKLSEDTFPYLFHSFSDHYAPVPYREKYQLLACDGSSFTFTRNPSDTDSFFSPSDKSSKGYNQIHVVPLFDLCSKTYTDAVIQPIRKKNEFQALTSLIDRHSSASGLIPVYIADRGFPSLNVFAHAIENNAFFMIRTTRVKAENLLGADCPPDGDEFDISIDRILTRSNSKKLRLHPERSEQYKYICKDVVFDYIDPVIKNEYPISLRVLRLKLPNSEYEYIITNLPEKEFPPKEILSLYNLRWGVETSFCILKHVVGAEYFHSKTRNFIEMEIWARLLLFNFCSIITAHTIIRRKGRKHSLQVNYSVAFNACRFFLRLHNGEVPPKIENLIERNTLPIRQNRNYARQQRFRVPVSFTYRLA